MLLLRASHSERPQLRLARLTRGFR